MTERKPADSTPDAWADLQVILKENGNGSRLTIEEMNELIANSWTAAGLAGLIPDEEIDRWVASWRTGQALPAPDLTTLLANISPDNLHGEFDFGPPARREIPNQDE
ncbi:TPA: hypothetical protein ACXJGC_002861 [Burkholderia cenocepacia]